MNDIITPIEVAIDRITIEVAPMPPFSQQRKDLVEERSKLIEAARNIRRLLNQS